MCFHSFLFVSLFVFICSSTLISKKLSLLTQKDEGGSIVWLSLCKTRAIPFYRLACISFQNWQNVTLLCTSFFHILSTVLLQNKKNVYFKKSIYKKCIYNLGRFKIVQTVKTQNDFKGVWTASKTWYTKQLGQETQLNSLHVWYSMGWNGHVN